MPAGSTDPNGVYQYGSSDTNATFHGLLNIANAILSTTIGAIKTRLTSLETSRDNPTIFVATSSTARDAYWGVPATESARLVLQNKGATTLRPDLGFTEIYLATYNASTNKGGANPAGWYPIDDSSIAQATRYNASAAVMPATATAVPALSAIGVAPGSPVSLEFDIQIENAGSGAVRTATFQFFEDTTPLGTARTFVLANVTNDLMAKLMFTYTPAPGLHTWTVKQTASAASAVQFYDAKLTVNAATPRF